MATSASATTPMAGTAQVSLRSLDAFTGSWVSVLTVMRGFMSVGMGFIERVSTRGWPLVMPPSRPPALLPVRP